MKLYALYEIADVYIDAAIADGANNLLFLSAWGHDTAIQELLAKLTLAPKQGGLAVLTLHNDENTKRIYIQERDRFVKHTGRLGKDSIFGNISHLWIYDELAKQMDRANQRALLFKMPEETAEVFSQRLWQVIQEICVIPLLSEWRELIDYFTEHNWIRTYRGINMDAVEISLGNTEVATLIMSLIQQHLLILPRQRPHLMLAYPNSK